LLGLIQMRRQETMGFTDGGQNVLLYALQADGALLAVADKLTRSTDRGCTWSTIAGPATGASWMDVFADMTNPARVLGIAWMTV